MLPHDSREFDASATIFGEILNTCRKFPDKEALLGRGGEGKKFTYRDVADLIGKTAGGLQERGVGKGDRVGILSENCPEWGISYLATLAAGGVVVPLDASLKDAELANLLRVSQIKLLFCSSKWFKPVSNIIVLNALQTELVVLEGEGQQTLEEFAGSKSFIVQDVTTDDTAVLIYTSGTTGDPKGVILTHRNILSNLNSIDKAIEFYENDTFLSVLPMHHTFEATCGFLFPLYLGLKIVYARSLKSRDLFQDIKSNDATVMVGVPLLYEKICGTINKKIRELPPAKRVSLKAFYAASKFAWRFRMKIGRTLFKNLREKAGFNTIRLYISGGAPLPSRVAEWFNLVGFDFLEGYGLTECSPVVSVNRTHDIRFGSVGPPLPDVELEIDNSSPDGIGEVKVRGPNNTPGYLDNPEATRDLLRDRWLFTGDMGKIEKRHLYITGRKKNLIVSGGGKNIYPEEIESELNLSDHVLESLVLGRKKSNKTGEEIWAIIVPDIEYFKASDDSRGKEPGPERIREVIAKVVSDVNHRLADYKRVARFEIRLEEFEKTSSRKIRRRLYK